MMNELIYKVKSEIDLTDEEYEELIEEYSVETIIKDDDKYGRTLHDILDIEGQLYLITWIDVSSPYRLHMDGGFYRKPILITKSTTTETVKYEVNTYYNKETGQLIAITRKEDE